MGFTDYIIYLFNFGLGAGAVLAFIMIVSGGITLVRSQGEPSKISEAKKKIINSLIGLVVLLTSYILLTTINPNIINIQNINLGNTGITVPIVGPAANVEEIRNYQFEEIPLGTLIEGILAGTSSLTNALPCYEYEHQTYDSNGNIIVGNVIDRNGDGKIDEKDIILNKDNFYCIKLLDDAIKQKIKVQLSSLIAELDSLMKTGCSCSYAYYGSISPNYPKSGEIKIGGPKCYCPYGISYCTNCGSRNGCPTAPTNPFVTSEGGFKQYQYDTCQNRLAIDCKRQEIKQLMDGTEPDQICYTEEYIKGKAPFNILTIKDGANRLSAFKSYYDKYVSDLEAAESKMKTPAGERLTLAEMNNNAETRNDASVTKKTFNGYSISRYCRESNCADGVCSLNRESRICKMDQRAQEYYTYAGDPATFYYDNKYNTDYNGETQVMDQQDNKCNIEDQDASEEMYGGLIRIGEAVDYTEAWGKEVAKRIDKIREEVQGMYSVGIWLYSFPDSCNSGNCSNGSLNKYNVCITPSCSSGGDCSCASVSIMSCQPSEPTEIICAGKEINGVCPQDRKALGYYSGCSYYCRTDPIVYQVQANYWTCPYRNLCNLVKSLYQRRTIERSCYEATDDEAEKNARLNNLNQVGYLQKMEDREKMLFELASVGEIKEEGNKAYENVSTTDVIGTICPDYMLPSSYDDLKCDVKLSVKLDIKDRFVLFNMLNAARERLNGCVKGYSYPYKSTADNNRILSCYEADNSSLVILPEFPYPDMSKATVDGKPAPYVNCYPYNSPDLTQAEKEACFYNINRTGVESNPGCLMITKDYMDNFYCCQ